MQFTFHHARRLATPGGPLSSLNEGAVKPSPVWTESLLWLGLLGFLFAAILFSRYPSVLLRAAFWGEDGWFWYPDAYNSGWRSLLWPDSGYLQTISRIVGLLAQPFPLAWAPTIFASAALVIEILPPIFLVSSRMEDSWPNARARLAFALIYVALPNIYEVYVNLTNAQWHLAALAFLVIVSRTPVTRVGIVFDFSVLLLSGLSGPFCLFLLPIAAWQVAENRSRTAVWRLGILLATGLVQATYLAFTVHTRSTAALGAGPRRLARIVSLYIVLGVLLGQHTLPSISEWPTWQASNILPVGITCGALVLGGFAWFSGPTLLRQFCLFAVAVFGAALAHPQISKTGQQWVILLNNGWGGRYYLFPMVAWIGVLFGLAGSGSRALKYTAVGLIILMTAEIPGDWSYPYMPRTDFLERAYEFETAPPGTTVKFQIHPPGNVMWLTKRGPAHSGSAGSMR